MQQTPKDWNAFYNACGEDEPIKSIIDLVCTLANDYDIIFCTGRRESCAEDTVLWINENFPAWSGHVDILMRKDTDFRHDTLVKPELLAEFLQRNPHYEIALILEDRNSMVAKWRELGYTCLQVADGDFYP